MLTVLKLSSVFKKGPAAKLAELASEAWKKIPETKINFL